VLEQIKSIFGIKDNVLFPIYDCKKQKLCFYFGQFIGKDFYVFCIDKTREAKTPFVYKVLKRLLEGRYIPVTTEVLKNGREDVDYYKMAIDHFMAKYGVMFDVPFTVTLSNTEEFECVITADYVVYVDDEENLSFLFLFLLKSILYEEDMKGDL